MIYYYIIRIKTLSSWVRYPKEKGVPLPIIIFLSGDEKAS